MEKDQELLEKVTIFLIVLVSAIILFTQYQFYRLLNSSLLVYLSVLLIVALVGLLVWLFVSESKDTKHKPHAIHAEHEAHAKPLTLTEKVSYGLMAVAAFLIIFNQIQISQASALAGLSTGLTFKTSSTKTSLALTGDPNQDAMTVVISRGVPFYGEALGVSFDDPIKSLDIIANLDPAYGRNKIQLSPEEKQRYISILTIPTMGCEYCCGANTAVTKDGRPTCGCKHSWAMRGLAAYLIKNYPQISDDEVKREVAKWKGMFFPKQMIQKYVKEVQTGQYTADISALLLDVDEEKLKEMKQAVASSGSAQGSSGAAQSVDSLPSMVGGC
ncbi:hypothetical protein HYW20_04325 [Candidatus Woesearchaeota archaeon]|nr:hypothetical protein [Candidatus Woesearchaeota archaeon]